MARGMTCCYYYYYHFLAQLLYLAFLDLNARSTITSFAVEKTKENRFIPLDITVSSNKWFSATKYIELSGETPLFLYFLSGQGQQSLSARLVSLLTAQHRATPGVDESKFFNNHLFVGLVKW